jgi:hypothetical protein
MAGYRPFTLIAALLFAIMAALHAYRIVTHFQIIVGSHTVPQGASWVGVIVLGLISLMLLKEAKR